MFVRRILREICIVESRELIVEVTRGDASFGVRPVRPEEHVIGSEDLDQVGEWGAPRIRHRCVGGGGSDASGWGTRRPSRCYASTPDRNGTRLSSNT